MTRLALYLCICLLISTAISAADPALANYRGDRNGWYPDATPPVQWDDAKGQNIRWKTELPNWCYGAPVVAGDKVFVMSEPGFESDFPELVCLSVATGEILWQQPVDHLEHTIPDDSERDRIRSAWSSLLKRMRLAFELVEEHHVARQSADEDAVEAVDAKIAELGFPTTGKGWKGFGNRSSAGGYGVLRGWGNGKHPGPDPKLGVSMKELRNHGLRLETFWGFGAAREGECFSTPVTDGTHVYVVTEQGTHACYDLDGKLVWLNWIKPTFNGGGHDDSICRSPMLVDGLFISDLHVDRDTRASKGGPRANPVIALDAKTGQVAWTSVLPLDAGRDHGCGSSKVMDIDGTNYFITTGGYVLRIADGKHMLSCSYGAKNDPNGPQRENAVCDRNDVLIYQPGSGQSMKNHTLVGLKLSADGDTLKEAELWRVNLRGSTHTMAVVDGKVYTGAAVIDTATGEMVEWSKATKVRIPTRWMVAVANGHLYTLRENGAKGGPKTGMATVYDITSGKQVAQNHLLSAPVEGRVRAMSIAGTGSPGWGFSYSCNFTFAGDAMFVRSHDTLFCVGK